MSDTPLGRFCWFDLVTPQPDEAPDFYRVVTGWGTTPFEGGERPYTMWTNGGAPIGGVTELPDEAVEEGAPPHWLAYVSTPDLGATTARARELGGTIHTEMTIDGVGSFAVITDPQGAVFAAFQPVGSTPGHDGPPRMGEFSWHELYAEDFEEALDYYGQLFGWEATDRMDMGDAGIYQMYGRGGRNLGGMMNRDDDMPPPMWMHYVRVADLDAAVEAVEANGGTVWHGPMEVPDGDVVALCRDPQQALFALHWSASG